METDKTTLTDLAIFNSEEEYSVFNKLNFTRTSNGKHELKKMLATPLNSIEAITSIQQTIQTIYRHLDDWPLRISNGSLLMVERFYETQLDPIPKQASSFTAYSYKLLHGPDFSLIKFSITHCVDLIKGMQQLVAAFLKDDTAAPLKNFLEQSAKILKNDHLSMISDHETASHMTMPELLQLAHFLKYHYRNDMFELIHIYAKLDAWYAMAVAVKKYELSFPVFIEEEKPYIHAQGLYHILLPQPVAYDVELSRGSNFLFLTGANMAGKSTFIKSIGTAVFMAHLGMGVPAQQMTLTVFDGLLSNINVVDNIVKGESYFFNEVQRIKATITKINDGRHWLILIDELFKGTNVQDAMKCSSTVIEGLLKVQKSVFILSTHLYEIGEALQLHSNIQFNYFETAVNDEQLVFNFTLKKGISNDRLGYIILQKEGVVKMLEGL
ncbi:MAG: DNA mismatch repair protein MutS [Ferruginibacter sp.]